MSIPVLAGWATVEITPALPCRMGGYSARSGLASVVHDPLSAHALALGMPAQPFVAIVCDLIAVDGTMVDETRRYLTARHPRATVWLGATHTHSGPDIGPPPAFSPDPTIRHRIIAGAVEAASESIARMHPVTVKRASGTLNSIATNRDHPEREADLSLDLLCFYDVPEQAQPSALFGSFPCHPTVLSADNLAISADLPGAFRRQLRALLGGTPWIALATGAAGDISTRHRRRRQGFDELERLGGLMAQQAYSLLRAARPLALAPPEVRSAVVSLERAAPFSQETLAASAQSIQTRMEAELQAGHVAQARTLETALQGIQAADRQSRASEERTRDVTVSVALLGELALAAVPGELYNRLSLTNKQTDERFVMLLGYTNGYEGYLPSHEAYQELDYEVLVSPFAPGSGERLAQSVARLLRDG